MNAIKNYIFIVFIFFLGILFSCTNNSQKINENKDTFTLKPVDSKELKWAEGVFEYTLEGGIYRENWKKTAENEFVGKGYFLIKEDTAFEMSMKLYKINNELKMNYNVKGQNDNKDVVFTLASHRNRTYVFENPFKNFPSVMQYTFIGDSVIEVLERGFENQKERTREFTILKVKENLMF